MRTLLALAFAAAIAGGASTASEAAPCQPGTLASYLALGAGGCEIGAASFRDFLLFEIPFGATPIEAAAVAVTPLLGDPLRPGLTFEVDAGAAAGELLEILVGYQVAAPALRGISLALEDSSVSGDGANTAVEDVCLGGTFSGVDPIGCDGTAAALIAFDVGSESELAASLGFADVTSLSVVKDVAVDGGLAGAAALGAATNRFHVVPEPGSAYLLGLGLALAARRARRR